MKFRNDFVTNSSSSSFMSVTFNFADSSEMEIEFPDDDFDLEDIAFHQSENGLKFRGYHITTIDEVAACLYFYDYGSAVPVFTSIFRFITKKTDFKTMINSIRNYKQNIGSALDWDEIDSLEHLSPEDFDDNDQLIDAVDDLFERNNKNLLNALDRLSDKYKNLSDIESIVFYENCSDYGEFINHFIEDLDNEDYIRKFFPQVDSDDPLFEKEFNKWSIKIPEIVFSNTVPGEKEIEFDDEFDIEAGLEYGDAGDCFGDIEHADTKKWLRFSISPQTNFTKIQYADQKSENNEDSDNVERNIYFQMDEIITAQYYSIKERSDRLKEFIHDHDIPKRFNQFPITDLLDYIIRNVYDQSFYPIEKDEILQTYRDVFDLPWEISCSECEKRLKDQGIDIEDGFKDRHKSWYENSYEYLNILPSIGIELDFDDVGHYIYNDSLETIYPLFDHGLKIVASDLDDLIKYADELDKPEYVEWLQTLKNETA